LFQLYQKILKIGCLNVEGLSGKMKNINFVRYMTQFHIFACVETWGIKHSDFQLAGYTVYNKTKEKASKYGHASSGISVFIKDSILKKNSCVVSAQCSDAMWIKLSHPFKLVSNYI